MAIRSLRTLHIKAFALEELSAVEALERLALQALALYQALGLRSQV